VSAGRQAGAGAGRRAVELPACTGGSESRRHALTIVRKCPWRWPLGADADIWRFVGAFLVSRCCCTCGRCGFAAVAAAAAVGAVLRVLGVQEACLPACLLARLSAVASHCSACTRGTACTLAGALTACPLPGWMCVRVCR
jgi:hypothetical protein